MKTFKLLTKPYLVKSRSGYNRFSTPLGKIVGVNTGQTFYCCKAYHEEKEWVIIFNSEELFMFGDSDQPKRSFRYIDKEPKHISWERVIEVFNENNEGKIKVT